MVSMLSQRHQILQKHPHDNLLLCLLKVPHQQHLKLILIVHQSQLALTSDLMMLVDKELTLRPHP